MLPGLLRAQIIRVIHNNYLRYTTNMRTATEAADEIIGELFAHYAQEEADAITDGPEREGQVLGTQVERADDDGSAGSE